MAEAGFAAFDWSDDRWTSYINNITIPANKPYEATMQKLKRKWYKKNVDDSLELEAASTPAPDPANDSEQPPAAAEEPKPKPADGSTAPPPAATTPSSLKEFVMRKDSVYFLMSLWLLFNTVAYLIPFFGSSSQAYHRACNAAFLKSFMKLFQTCLLYTSDAADEEDSVDLGGRRIIKKKKKEYEGVETSDV
eukprot:TRINITY_DN14708_c0_g2_i3.p2 TRINITY_DN14708_c0_g2~~TRINITY_DN14708_c0_g2_i3.p2  ORF type:complete len:192 (+),score=59.78 TRINITY_DN14708_c0_g2_i3:53-628(+)